MVDYTKFELKDRKELAEVLKDKDNLFVLACKKCFKEFDLIEEPELHEFEQLAKEERKNIAGSLKVDFLCNNILTPKLLPVVLEFR